MTCLQLSFLFTIGNLKSYLPKNVSAKWETYFELLTGGLYVYS